MDEVSTITAKSWCIILSC